MELPEGVLGVNTPSPDFCHSCGRDEPVPPSGAYRICLECGHVYHTETELLLVYSIERMVTRMTEAMRYCTWIPASPLPKSGEDIYYCPLCLHDF